MLAPPGAPSETFRRPAGQFRKEWQRSFRETCGRGRRRQGRAVETLSATKLIGFQRIRRARPRACEKRNRGRFRARDRAPRMPFGVVLAFHWYTKKAPRPGGREAFRE